MLTLARMLVPDGLVMNVSEIANVPVMFLEITCPALWE